MSASSLLNSGLEKFYIAPALHDGVEGWGLASVLTVDASADAATLKEHTHFYHPMVTNTLLLASTGEPQ